MITKRSRTRCERGPVPQRRRGRVATIAEIDSGPGDGVVDSRRSADLPRRDRGRTARTAVPPGRHDRDAARRSLRPGWSDLDLDAGTDRSSAPAPRHTVALLTVDLCSPSGPRPTTAGARGPRPDDGSRAQDPAAAAAGTPARHGPGWSNEHDLVFTLPDGRPLDPESVAKVFDRRVARAGCLASGSTTSDTRTSPT